MYRLLADILLFLSIFLLPWWITTVMALTFFFVFNSYYELLIVGLLFDSVYATPLTRFGGFQAVHTVIGVFAFLMLFFIRKRIRI